MPRKAVIGAGITAREVIEYDAKAGEGPSADSWNQAIEEGGGLFGAVSLQAARTCAEITASGTNETPIEDSPEDFARTIVKYIECTKDSIVRGDSDRAARLAFSAGVEWATAVMKWGWEKDALRGEKVAGGERNAAHQTNERHAPLRNRRLARMRELTASMVVDKAAAQCETEGLGSQSAVKGTWYRHQKKCDT